MRKTPLPNQKPPAQINPRRGEGLPYHTFNSQAEYETDRLATKPTIVTPPTSITNNDALDVETLGIDIEPHHYAGVPPKESSTRASEELKELDAFLANVEQSYNAPTPASTIVRQTDHLIVRQSKDKNGNDVTVTQPGYKTFFHFDPTTKTYVQQPDNELDSQKTSGCSAQ